MPKVVRAPGERRGLLGCGEGGLACFGPGAPVGDRRQLAASHAAEETAVRGSAELRKVITEQPGQFRVGRDDAAVSVRPVLELPPLPQASIISPLTARVGRCAANVQL